MDLEEQIQGLQRELAEVEKEQADLRLQPCKGDSEIMAKDLKYEELDKRATILKKKHLGPCEKMPAVNFRIQ